MKTSVVIAQLVVGALIWFGIFLGIGAIIALVAPLGLWQAAGVGVVAILLSDAVRGLLKYVTKE